MPPQHREKERKQINKHKKTDKIMAINIKAKETLQNIGPYKDTYRYVMGTERYIVKKYGM